NTFGIGSEVLFVGRFMGFDGQESNRPSVRFGNISICPPVVINIPRANQTHPQESFLVEARSLPGYSGSPVYWLRQVPRRSGDYTITLQPAYAAKLLGVDHGHLPQWDDVYEQDQKTPSWARLRVNLNSGMMVVIPAWKIRELLDIPHLVETRNVNE